MNHSSISTLNSVEMTSSARHNASHSSPDVNVTSEYDYYYDYPHDTLANIPAAELIPVSLVYSLTLVLGTIGNGLVIVCISRYRRMHSVTNIFLVSLASADLLLVCACVPLKFVRWFVWTWTFGEVLCKFVHYLQNVSVICSVLTLTVMSLERYYAILQPMQARSSCTSSRAKKLVFVIWLLSLGLATPILKGQILKQVGLRYPGYWCVKEWPEPAAIWAPLYEVSMLLLVLVLPLGAMTFAYASICVELWIMTSKRIRLTASVAGQHRRSMARVTSSTPPLPREVGGVRGSQREVGGVRGSQATLAPRHDDNRTRKQVIKMLVAIVLLFALCWAPSLVDNVLVSFRLVDSLHVGPLKPMRQAFALMSYFNSCVNPIVYAFMSRNFRNSFKNALCGACANSVPRRRANNNTTAAGAERRLGGVAGGTRRLHIGNAVHGGGFRGEFQRETPDGAEERISMVYALQHEGRSNTHGGRCGSGGGMLGPGGQFTAVEFSTKHTELFDIASSHFD